MNDQAFQKRPTRVIKSYGISPDAVIKIERLSTKYGISKSQIVNDLVVEADADSIVVEDIFVYAIKAQVKGRPRFSKGTTFTDSKTRKYEQEITKALAIWWGEKEVITAPVKCSLAFQFKEPKKSAKGYPSQMDLDNLIKAFLDAANNLIWKDDRQVVDIRASKTFGSDDRVTFGVVAV